MSENSHADSLKVFLFRHPETDWNEARRYQGLTDRPWTEKGSQRAEQLADSFQETPLSLLIHSPRCHTRLLAEKLSNGDTALTEDSSWAEIDHGTWEGLTYDEVSKQFPESCRERFANPLTSQSHGGETLQTISSRIIEAWETLPRHGEHDQIGIVTHATPIQIVLCHLTGLPLERHWQFRIDCGSITSLEITSGGTIINFCNHT